MLGSGEKTVAPTIVLPSRSFCFAVLKIRAGAFCCCPCASVIRPPPPRTIQASAMQIAVVNIAVNEREYRLLIGFPPWSSRPGRSAPAQPVQVGGNDTTPAYSPLGTPVPPPCKTV